MRSGHFSVAKRGLSILLAGSFLLSVSACKKKKKNSESDDSGMYTSDTEVVRETDPFF